MSTDSTVNINFLHSCSPPISLPSIPPMFPSPPLSPAAMAWWFFLTATCIKLLLIPTYHSTDFEVHHHWLTLTHSLPLHQWYTETNSEWTLDYPPLFAYFEFLLSFPATLVDPTIVHLQQGIRYSAFSVVIFQRVSVLVADLVLLLGVFIVVRRKRCDLDRKKPIFLLVIWSPAVDCGSRAFPVQWFSYGCLVGFFGIYGGRKGFSRWNCVCYIDLLQAFVCGCGVGILRVHIEALLLGQWCLERSLAVSGDGDRSCVYLSPRLWPICLSWTGNCVVILMLRFSAGNLLVIIELILFFYEIILIVYGSPRRWLF